MIGFDIRGGRDCPPASRLSAALPEVLRRL
jgi:hypothetical protein